MKNHQLLFEYADFLFILLFFVLPPLFVPFEPQFSIPQYRTVSVLFYLLLGAFLFLAARRSSAAPTGKPVTLLKKLLLCTAALALLGAFTAMLSFFGHVFQWTQQFAATSETPVRSGGFAETAQLFAITAVLASYEELLYRFYLPVRLNAALKTFFGGTLYERKTDMAVEIAVALLFALAHRYLGLLPVFNALGAAVILRLTVKKTGTVWSACAVHTLYNCGILFLQMQ